MLAELVAAAGVLAGSWESGPPLPLARSEVAGAAWRDQIVVAGGFLDDGQSSARVDAYTPRVQLWRRLPDLPLAVNHAMAAAGGGRLYVVGGYGAGRPRRDAFVLDGSRWRRLPSLPFARAAAGAAVVDNTLYVAGGVGPFGIARSLLAYDIRRKRWRTLPGASPREHLGVTALRGRLYAVGGRAAGRLFSIVERWAPRERRWRRLASAARRDRGRLGQRRVDLGGRGVERRHERCGLRVLACGQSLAAPPGFADPSPRLGGRRPWLDDLRDRRRSAPRPVRQPGERVAEPSRLIPGQR
jgi:hypothetical protein